MSTKRKQNHKRKPIDKAVLASGEGRVTHVAAKNGSYARVTLEYRSHSADTPGLGRAITDAMYAAARSTDLRVLATQVPELIVEGEILTPDGTYVVETWIPAENELLVLKARPATMQNLAELPIYNEPEDQVEARKKKAADLLIQAAFGSAAEPVHAPA